MSDFVHTMRVTVTLDDGRVIQATNSYVIPGVLFVAQQGGDVGGIAPGNTPPIEASDFLIMQGVSGDSFAEYANGADDTFLLYLSEYEVSVLHGPAMFEQDTNAATGTNAGVFATVAFSSTPSSPMPSYMSLNNTAS